MNGRRRVMARLISSPCNAMTMRNCLDATCQPSVHTKASQIDIVKLFVCIHIFGMMTSVTCLAQALGVTATCNQYAIQCAGHSLELHSAITAISETVTNNRYVSEMLQ